MLNELQFNFVDGKVSITSGSNKGVNEKDAIKQILSDLIDAKKNGIEKMTFKCGDKVTTMSVKEILVNYLS